MKENNQNRLYGSRFVVCHFIVLLYTLTLIAQSVKILKENEQEIYVKFTIPEYSIKSVKINGEKCSYIQMSEEAKAVFIEEIKGFPLLPSCNRAIMIPDRGAVRMEVIDTVYHEIQINKILPARGIITRRHRLENIPSEFGYIYEQNTWYPSQCVTMGTPFIQRDIRGIAVGFNPFAYNGLKKSLRLYAEIIIKIQINNADAGKNSFPIVKKNKIIDREFHHMYSRNFLNYHSNGSLIPTMKKEGMLIMCHPDFLEAMAPFVEWKKKRGITTDLVNIHDVGSKPQVLKQYIQNKYAENNLKFVLLVGDDAHIPSFTVLEPDTVMGYRYADNVYGCLVGDDSFQEVIIGRFPGNQLQHITTQIERTIAFEKKNNPLNSWDPKILVIGNGVEKEYQKPAKIILEQIDNSFFKKGIGAFSKNAPRIIKNAYTLGLSFIFQTGMGSKEGGSRGFTKELMNHYNSTRLLPIVFAAGSWMGEFSGVEDCFAESLVKSVHNGQPTGALGVVMPTISQPWQMPDWGLQEMCALITSNDTVLTDPLTFGGTSVQGFNTMLIRGMGGAKTLSKAVDTNTIAHRDNPLITTANTWTVFGDPSLMIQLRKIDNLEISHPDTIILDNKLGITILGTSGATVCLYSKKNAIQQIGVIRNGFLVFELEAVDSTDTFYVTATKQNYTTYEGIIRITSLREKETNNMYYSEKGLKISPNSSGGDVSFEYDGSKKLQHFDLTVFDSSGRIVYQTEKPNKWNLIDDFGNKAVTDESYLAVLVIIDETGSIDIIKKSFGIPK